MIMKKITLLKSLFVVLALSLFSFSVLAQTTVGTYKKVTAAPANGDWSGQYIIVNTNAAKIYDCSLKNNTGEVPTYIKTAGVVISADKSTIEVTQAAVDAIQKSNVDMGYTAAKGDFHVTIDKANRIFAASGYYMAANSTSSNGLLNTADSTVAATKHEITFRTSDGAVVMKSVNGSRTKYFQNNSTNFHYVTSSTKGAIFLYKLVVENEGGEGEGDGEGDGGLVIAPTVEVPTVDMKPGDYLEPFDLTLACATEGATIKYTLNAGAEQTYSAPIRISATTTVEAWAEKDGGKSAKTTFTYNLPAEVANIAAFIADASGKQVRIASTMTVILRSSASVWVKDESGYMLVSGQVASTNPSYNAGDQFTGLVGTATTAHGVKQLTPANFPAATAKGVAVEPEVVAAADVTLAIPHKYVKIEGATLVSKNMLELTASVGEITFRITDIAAKYLNDKTIVVGDYINLAAIVSADAKGLMLNLISMEKAEQPVVAIDARYTETPAVNDELYKLSEVVLTFADYDSIFINDVAANGMNWLPCDKATVIPGDEELGTPAQTTWSTVAPMQWSAVKEQKNAIRIFVSEEMTKGKFNSVTGAGNYKLTIPEGLVSFAKSATSVTYNKPIELNYTLKDRGITATFDIAEGDTIESLSAITVTFAGADSVYRKLDGVEVQKAVAQGSSTNVLLYSVDAEGNLTPAGKNGLLSAKTNNLAITYSLTEDKGYKLVGGKFMAKGNYRLVIDAGDVLFTPNRANSLPKVYNDETYVLNFTIDNDYVERTAVEPKFKANPANEARLLEIREAVLTFADYDSIFIDTLTAAGQNYLALESAVVIPEDELTGAPARTMWNTVAPMQWSAVEGKKNAIRIFVSEAMFQKAAVTDLGDYRIVIPEDLISFTKTDAAETYNKEFTLNYSIVNPVLTVNVNDPAKGSVDVATGEYKAGTTVTLTATPAEGYKLLAWSDRSTENTLTVTMDGNKAVTAYFVKDYPVEPTFTMEKVWETTVPANPIQGVGRDGVFYMKSYYTDAAAGTIHAVTKDGVTEFATGTGTGSNLTMDEAGNLITSSNAYPGSLYTTIIAYQKGSNVGKEITFEVNSARQDFFSASGDIFSAEGGYVYFYCSGQTVVNRVKIANGEFVGADEVGTALGAGSTRNHVMMDIFGNLVAHPRSGVVNTINFTTGESTAFTLPNHKKSTLGGCSFELGGKEFWAYNVGATNYNSEWNLYNYTDGKFLSETALTVNDDDYTTNGAYANWIDVQVVEDTAFIYHYCPKVGAAVWKVTFNADLTEVSTMEELKANEGKLVLYKGLEPAKVTMGEGMMSYTEYFMPDGETALNYPGYVLPAKMDVYGTYYTKYAADEWSDSVSTFVISKVEAIHAFYNMGDLVNFVENEATDEQKMASYEIKETALVTLAGPMSFYIQYEAQSMWGGASWKGLAAQTGRMTMLQFMPKAGDEITLKGSYNAPMYDDEYNMLQPGFFAVENATLVSENNKLHYTPFDLSVGLEYASEYYASLVRLSKGGKIVEDDMGLYYEFDFEAWVEGEEGYEQVIGKDSLVLMVAGPVDLEQYIGKELDMLLAGVLDYDAYSQTPILYVSELQESKLYYNNIAELIAAGAQNDYSMPSALRNPVLLTYISYNEWAGYTIFVQDATGAIAIKGVGAMDEEGAYTFPYEVAVGDSITGIEGFTTLEAAAFMWSGADYNVDLNLTKVAEGTIEPIDITLADFNADVELVQEAVMNSEFYLSEYANKVVRVQGLTRVDDPEDEKWPWLRQGEDSIKVSTYYWGEIAVADSIVSLTGIADYTIINGQTASIQPLNAESVVVPAVEDAIEYATLTDLYVENGMIVTEGEFQIFTVTGQNVTNMNGRLTSGVYVVRTATAVGKVVIK